MGLDDFGRTVRNIRLVRALLLYDMAKEEWPPAPPMRFVWRLVKAGPEEKRKSEAALPELFESVPRQAALAKDRARPALCAGRSFLWKNILLLRLQLLLLQRGSAVQRHLGDDGTIHPQEE